MIVRVMIGCALIVRVMIGCVMIVRVMIGCVMIGCVVSYSAKPMHGCPIEYLLRIRYSFLTQLRQLQYRDAFNKARRMD